MNQFIDRIDSKIDSKLPQTPEAIARRKNRILKPLAIAGIAGALFAGYKVYENATAEPHYSSDTTSYTVEDGDGLYDAADAVHGINNVSLRDVVDHIESMPQNKEALEDGLQPGEQLVIPESVTK